MHIAASMLTLLGVGRNGIYEELNMTQAIRFY